MRNSRRAVVPDYLDRAATTFCREIESDLRARRIGQSMNLWIPIRHLSHDRRRRGQIERPIRGIHHVTGPIADGAGTVREPSTPIPWHPERGIGVELGGS